MSSQREKRDFNILFVTYTFLEHHGRMSDKELSELLPVSSSTVGRYLTSERLKELIGVNNFAYIKHCRYVNKRLGRKKGGERSTW